MYLLSLNFAISEVWVYDPCCTVYWWPFVTQVQAVSSLFLVCPTVEVCCYKREVRYLLESFNFPLLHQADCGNNMSTATISSVNKQTQFIFYACWQRQCASVSCFSRQSISRFTMSRASVFFWLGLRPYKNGICVFSKLSARSLVLVIGYLYLLPECHTFSQQEYCNPLVATTVFWRVVELKKKGVLFNTLFLVVYLYHCFLMIVID